MYRTTESIAQWISLFLKYPFLRIPVRMTTSTIFWRLFQIRTVTLRDITSNYRTAVYLTGHRFMLVLCLHLSWETNLVKNCSMAKGHKYDWVTVFLGRDNPFNYFEADSWQKVTPNYIVPLTWNAEEACLFINSKKQQALKVDFGEADLQSQHLNGRVRKTRKSSPAPAILQVWGQLLLCTTLHQNTENPNDKLQINIEEYLILKFNVCWTSML